MNLLNWAENEIRIALAKAESVESNEDTTAIEDGNYYKACCLSALTAFRCLCGDGHSGSSIQVTKTILDALIDGRPLTPIEEEDGLWNFSWEENGKTCYQCKRMSSLFKTVDSDGKVDYSDNNYVVCVSLEDPRITYHSSLVSKLIHEMYPITLPYSPTVRPYAVKCQDILSDSNNGDFDTVALFELSTPTGEVLELNRYFKESDNFGWEEIDEREWKERLAMHQQRLEALKAEQETDNNDGIS